jgi:hypothetical protein
VGADQGFGEGRMSVMAGKGLFLVGGWKLVECTYHGREIQGEESHSPGAASWKILSSFPRNRTAVEGVNPKGSLQLKKF